MKGVAIEVEKPNVMLTTRDLRVLESLYSNCVMTFSQIAQRHFTGAAKPTIINRLTKLEVLGVIRRERIPRMELGADKNAVGVVYQVTRKGIVELRQRQTAFEFKPQPISYNPFSLNHDLLLVDLSDALKVRIGNCTVTNGKLLTSNGQSANALEPDLVVKLPNEPGLVAIELELNDKSERRYRELVLRYRLAKEYAQVIYFVDDPFIRVLLTRVMLTRNPHPLEKPSTGKFYFSKASEFLKHPETTAITNGGVDLWEKGGRA